MKRFWTRLKDYLSGADIKRAQKRNAEAARELDMAVKEVLGQ